MSSKYTSVLAARTPEEKSGILGRIFFTWLLPLFAETFKNGTLKKSDLIYLRSKDHSSRLLHIFNKAWNSMQNNDENDPSLYHTIYNAFGGSFLWCFPLTILQDIFYFSSPVFLSIFLEANEKQDFTLMYTTVALSFIASYLSTVFLQQYFAIALTVGMRVRGALMAACYSKLMRISSSERGKMSSGEIMNLITVDLSKIQTAFTNFWVVFSAPFQIALCLYLLYQQLQYSIFVGVGLQVIFVLPFQLILGWKIKQTQQVLMEVRDQRMKIISEVFSSMKVIKMYSWEISFGEKISKCREEEIQLLKQYMKWEIIFIAVIWFAPTIVTACSFASYVALGNELTASKAFVSLALFDLLRFPFNIIPMFSYSYTVGA